MLVDAKDSVLLLIDFQASLVPLVNETKRMVAVARKLVSIARDLEIPLTITEHYPEGLKPTVPEIAEHLGEDYAPLVKRVFSCYGLEEFRDALENSNRRTLIVTGVETHICVLQTVLQSLDAGYKVFVVADGVGARSQFDHDIALNRMAAAGAQIVTWEMVVYEWMRRADTPEFKKVLPHIKAGLE